MDFRPSLASQKGSALIFAVGLCTLVVILATSMILALHHDMRRFDHLNDTVAELAVARSATSWALSILADDDIKNKTAQIYTVDLNGIQVSASLIDIDGLFNVNTLISDEAEGEFSAAEIFERLLKALSIDDSMVAAMRRQEAPLVYLSQMKAEFELPQAMYDVLLPYVRANTEGDRPMNVNTMSPILLGALLEIEEAVAKEIVEMGPFESESQFNEALSQLSIQIPSAGLSEWLKYDSQQYLVHAQMKAKGMTEIYTLLAPQEKGWRVVYQSTGVRL